jgi:hypothetical protein
MQLKTDWVIQSVKLLLVILDFSLLEIHDLRFFISPGNIHSSKWGLLFDEGGVSLSV